MATMGLSFHPEMSVGHCLRFFHRVHCCTFSAVAVHTSNNESWCLGCHKVFSCGPCQIGVRLLPRSALQVPWLAPFIGVPSISIRSSCFAAPRPFSCSKVASRIRSSCWQLQQSRICLSHIAIIRFLYSFFPSAFL